MTFDVLFNKRAGVFSLGLKLRARSASGFRPTVIKHDLQYFRPTVIKHGSKSEAKHVEN